MGSRRPLFDPALLIRAVLQRLAVCVERNDRRSLGLHAPAAVLNETAVADIRRRRLAFSSGGPHQTSSPRTRTCLQATGGYPVRRSVGKLRGCP